MVFTIYVPDAVDPARDLPFGVPKWWDRRHGVANIAHADRVEVARGGRLAKSLSLHLQSYSCVAVLVRVVAFG